MPDLLQNAIKNAMKNKTFDLRTKEANEWLKRKASARTKDNAEKRSRTRTSIINNAERHSSRIKLGQMYLYSYDAKYKDTLPYWDFYPLIFPFEFTDNGWYGINMHYLPPMMRAKLLDIIMDQRTYKFGNDKDRAVLSYKIIKSFSSTNLAKPTIHRYLRSQLKSPLAAINRDEWSYVTFLPLADWRSKTSGNVTAQKVYADSMRKM